MRDIVEWRGRSWFWDLVLFVKYVSIVRSNKERSQVELYVRIELWNNYLLTIL